MRRLATIIVSVGVGLGSLALGDANASPIRPDQRFEGLVNGGHDNVTLLMACFGPIQPGQTGHPMGGQTVAVKTGRSFSGFTGSAGMAIVARFLDDRSVGVRFTEYGVTQPVSTSLNLPCAGIGKVRFAPRPNSATSTPDFVTVHFVGQP